MSSRNEVHARLNVQTRSDLSKFYGWGCGYMAGQLFRHCPAAVAHLGEATGHLGHRGSATCHCWGSIPTFTPRCRRIERSLGGELNPSPSAVVQLPIATKMLLTGCNFAASFLSHGRLCMYMYAAVSASKVAPGVLE